MGKLKKIAQEFKEVFKDLDFGHGMTWTDEGEDVEDMPYFAWHDPNAPILTYYILVYLLWDGSIMIKCAYPGSDDLWQDFDCGEYEQAKNFILNYFDNTEAEEN